LQPASSNGINVPSSLKGSTSGSSSKPKPGTVAAALEEKKKSKGVTKSNPVAIDHETADSEKSTEPSKETGSKSATEHLDENETSEGGEEDKEEQSALASEQEANTDGLSSKDKNESRKGLTSEERVLLREKKRQRLAKEQETAESTAGPATTASAALYEKVINPNPFDDDDENDEDEVSPNARNDQNNIDQLKSVGDESRPNSADSEAEEGKEKKRGGKGKKRKSEDRDQTQSPPPMRSTRDSTRRCTRASKNAS
jgi:hypothetical protein